MYCLHKQYLKEFEIQHYLRQTCCKNLVIVRNWDILGGRLGPDSPFSFCLLGTLALKNFPTLFNEFFCDTLYSGKTLADWSISYQSLLAV